MRYCYIDFYPWDKNIIIPQLEKEGKYVYSVADIGGTHFLIGKGLLVNRYAYMVTDEPINGVMSDSEFYALSPIEDHSLKTLTKNLDQDIRNAKELYDSKRGERDAEREQIIQCQQMEMNLEKKYPLFNKCGKKRIPRYKDGKVLILQYISVIGTKEGEMKIGYFIRDELTNKIIKDSDTVIVPRGCATSKWLRAIEKKELLSGRSYVSA